jgi:hypothetical protein
MVSAVLSINNNDHYYTERERKVIELYKQGKRSSDFHEVSGWFFAEKY